MLRALSADDVEASLLAIGKKDYAQRISTLTERIEQWKDAGLLGDKRYRAETNEFTED